MRYRFLFLLFCSVIMYSQNEKKITVSFKAKIENRLSDTLSVYDIKDKLISKIIFKDGLFQDVFETSETIHSIYDGQEMVYFFLKNNGCFELKMDTKSRSTTLVFFGNGAEESSYLTAKILIDKEFNSNVEEILNEDEFTFKDRIHRKKETELIDLQKSGFSSEFVKLIKSKIDFDFEMLEKQYQKKLFLRNLVGAPSPNFEYENHKGGKTSLESLKGKYVYIDVWATWCGPCRAEIPHLKKAEEKYHGKNIEFVSISVDTDNNHEKWQNFVTNKKLGGIQLFADKNLNSDFIKAYGINSIPRFILIGPKGEVVNADAPRPSSAELEKMLDELLK